MLQKNQTLVLSIEEMTNLGYGVARDPAGQIVFVSGAVTGDTVEARIIRVTRGYAIAKTEKVLTPSPFRVDDCCTAKGCGGCAFRLVAYDYEISCKQTYVKKCLSEAGLASVDVAPVVSGKLHDGYRNKAQYPVGRTPDGNVYFGFFAPKSHRVVEASHCPLQPLSFGKILDTLGAYFNEKRMSVYNEETGEGLLRHVYLRESSFGKVLLTLVINGKKLPDEDGLVQAVCSAHPNVVGISLNVQTKKTNVICGEEYRSLYGERTLTDTLAGVSLKIAPDAFYQVNHEVAELLYEGARRAADLQGNEVLLDLYCGVGSIGLSMADAVKEVIGIEIVPEAVRCAKENAKQNGIKNAFFYLGDAGKAEMLLARAEEERGERILPDVVVLDPPRKGCDERLLHFLGTLSPQKIVYISCNPQTLARDLAVLDRIGFSAKKVTPYNLFPRTGHVESVVCLKRQIQQ